MTTKFSMCWFPYLTLDDVFFLPIDFCFIGWSFYMGMAIGEATPFLPSQFVVIPLHGPGALTKDGTGMGSWTPILV